MKTELKLFGKQVSMASQSQRRRLVMVVYSAFAALMAAGWFLDRWGMWGSLLTIVSVSLISKRVFGGYGAEGRGLIKPFLGNEVRARYARNPNSAWSRFCRATIPAVTDERAFCSDEREVRRRDGAHEVAYRRLAMVMILTLLVAYLQRVFPLPRELSVGLDQLIYGMLLASFVLIVSLPQAILLWTEPDLVSESEAAEDLHSLPRS